LTVYSERTGFLERKTRCYSTLSSKHHIKTKSWWRENYASPKIPLLEAIRSASRGAIICLRISISVFGSFDVIYSVLFWKQAQRLKIHGHQGICEISTKIQNLSNFFFFFFLCNSNYEFDFVHRPRVCFVYIKGV
jgi:hypothetical protein